MSLLPRFSFRPSLLGWVLAALCVSPMAIADDGARFAQVALLPVYKTECAACHLAYPPGMLPAAAWQRVLSNLPHHYGATDASLDPATVKALSIWLSANSAKASNATNATNASNASNASNDSRLRGAPPDDRITRSPWFIRQHDEVPAAAWKRTSIKSASNCAACHGGAEQGDFNERNVRIPR